MNERESVNECMNVSEGADVRRIESGIALGMEVNLRAGVRLKVGLRMGAKLKV